MTAKAITTLPSPYKTFESFCKIYAYLRLHAIIRPYTHGEYMFTLFRLMPYNGLYSQICIDVAVPKAMEYLNLQMDAIKFHDRSKTSGDVFLQISMKDYEQMMEWIGKENGKSLAKY